VVGPSHGKAGLLITFWTPLTADEVNRNIWKLRLAALDQSQVVHIMQVVQFPNFKRVAVPDKPLPFGAPRSMVTEPGDMYRYEYLWTGYDKATQLQIDKYCSEEGRIFYGTSLWFEDVLGHRSLPEQLAFQI
jgi:hypothetical protein